MEEAEEGEGVEEESSSSLDFWDHRCISLEIFFSPMSLEDFFFTSTWNEMVDGVVVVVFFSSSPSPGLEFGAEEGKYGAEDEEGG